MGIFITIINKQPFIRLSLSTSFDILILYSYSGNIKISHKRYSKIALMALLSVHLAQYIIYEYKMNVSSVTF